MSGIGFGLREVGGLVDVRDVGIVDTGSIDKTGSEDVDKTCSVDEEVDEIVRIASGIKESLL